MKFRKKDQPPKFNPSPGLVRLAYRLLLEDKAMVAVLAVGGAATTVVLAAILVPAWTVAHVRPDVTQGGVAGFLVYAAAIWSASFISVLTSGVVVAAAQIRCEGGEPDLRRALAVAWSRRGALAAWAALSTVVALLMRLLERTGIAGIVVRLLAGVTWGVATVFAVPILISEGTNPVETVRRSSDVVRHKLGTIIRSNVRLALPWIVATIFTGMVALTGIIVFSIGMSNGDILATFIGAVLMMIGGIAFFFCAATSSALTAYLDTLLYRYAVGLPVPEIQPRDLPPAPLAYRPI